MQWNLAYTIQRGPLTDKVYGKSYLKKKLRVKSTETADPFVLDVEEKSTWGDLIAILYASTGLNDFEGSLQILFNLVLVGYPPHKLIGTSRQQLLQDIPIKNGDSLLLQVSKKETAVPDEYPILVVKEIDADNSCLFNSIRFLLDQRESATTLRKSSRLPNCSSCCQSAGCTVGIQRGISWHACCRLLRLDQQGDFLGRRNRTFYFLKLLRSRNCIHRHSIDEDGHLWTGKYVQSPCLFAVQWSPLRRSGCQIYRKCIRRIDGQSFLF
jgi:hypothetical protein